MGPIERELYLGTRRPRDLNRWIWGSMSTNAFHVVRDAVRSLGFDSMYEAWAEGCLPDVLSEAIEAAEALGL